MFVCINVCMFACINVCMFVCINAVFRTPQSHMSNYNLSHFTAIKIKLNQV